MNPLLFCAIGVVRGWTRFYTLHMDPPDRDRRRAEIDSDLWELQEDARRRRCAPATITVLMLARLILGVAHDVMWRIEHEGEAAMSPRRSTWMTAAAIGATVCIAALWAFFAAVSIGALPPLPDSVHVERVYRVTMPPPPPPPGGLRVPAVLMPPPPPPPPPR